MFFPALPTEGEADNESSSKTVFILATGYLAVSLLFHAVFFLIISHTLVNHSCSNRRFYVTIQLEAVDIKYKKVTKLI